MIKEEQIQIGWQYLSRVPTLTKQHTDSWHELEVWSTTNRTPQAPFQLDGDNQVQQIQNLFTWDSQKKISMLLYSKVMQHTDSWHELELFL
jgi:hypothetical protein